MKAHRSPGLDAPSSDDDLADAIVRALRPGRPIEKSALSDVKSRIEKLRGFVQPVRTELRPSETKKTIEQIVSHAQALASSVEALSPRWRQYLSFLMFCERSKDGNLAPRPDSDRKARSGMDEWVYDLKEIPEIFGQMPNSLRDYFPGSKALCAFEARSIILTLSPTTGWTKGDRSKFYAVASFLWEAISGEKEKSMKRACDSYINKRIRPKKRAIAAKQPEE
jgi:hypothetical protein